MRKLAILGTLLVTLSANAQNFDILDVYPHRDGLQWTYEGPVIGTNDGQSISLDVTIAVSHAAIGFTAQGYPIIRETLDFTADRLGTDGNTITIGDSSEADKQISGNGIFLMNYSDNDIPGGLFFDPLKHEYPRIISVGQAFVSEGALEDSNVTPEGPASITLNGTTYETLAMEVAIGTDRGTAYMVRGFGIIAIDLNVTTSNGTVITGRLELTSSSQTLTNTPLTDWLWAGSVNLGNGNGWRWSEWFGSFFLSESGWIYDFSEGWIYPTGTNPDDFWLYSANRGNWMWTAVDIAPFFWSVADNEWVVSPRQ